MRFYFHLTAISIRIVQLDTIMTMGDKGGSNDATITSLAQIGTVPLQRNEDYLRSEHFMR